MGIIKTGRIDTGGGHRVQIDAGNDGSIVVLSTEDGEFLSRVAANGTVTTLAPTTAFGNFRSGYVETLSDGRYALFTTNHFGLGADARVQILGTDGSPATGIIDPAFENGQTNSLSGYTLAPTQDGGFAFAWNDISRGADQYQLTFNGGPAFVSGGSDVRVRYFDSNAAPTTPSVVADEDIETISGVSASRRAADQYINDTATLAGGETAFVYLDNRIVGSPDGKGAHAEWEISVQISAPGNVGEPIKVDLGPYNEQFGTSYPQAIDPAAGANIVALPDGSFAVIWTENVYKPANVHGNYVQDGWSNVIRYFDSDGNALTDPIEIVRRGTDHGNHSKYVWGEALADGRIAIAYNVGVGGVNGNGTLDAFLGIVGPLGSSIEVTRVNPVAAANTQFYTISDLAVRSNGTIDLVYTDAATGQNGQNLNRTVIEQFNGQPANRPPVGAADQYGVNQDQVLSVAAAQGVLANDSDPDGGALTALLSSGPANGALQLNADGSFGYTPNANFSGTDSFSYIVRDAAGADSAPVTVQINVAEVPEVELLPALAQMRASVSGGDGGANDVRALYGDRRGTSLEGGAGDDVLRGGNYDDLLNGGSGNDQMFGSAGADQFRFYGTQIDGASDRDRIYDLSFAEGDLLVLADFALNTFANAGGVSASSDGTSAALDSYADLVAAAAGSNLVTVSRASPYNNNLLLTVQNAGGQLQEILISAGWTQYVAAGGSDGL